MSSSMSVVPKMLMTPINQIKADPTLGIGVQVLSERANEFPNELAATLVGIAMAPDSRVHMNRALDAMWERNTLPKVKSRPVVDEVVIGGGLHAAIYCAIRVQMGHPKPMVLEASPRVGGALGSTESAVFYLNSRNRPGSLGAPGSRDQALNVLPGAPIQPADLSLDEYQRNSDLGFIIRTTLGMYADVYPNAKVLDLSRAFGYGKNKCYIIGIKGAADLRAKRVIIATGLGRDSYSHENQRYIMSYSEFMRHMDTQMFPLKGLKRVAVLGCGDGGKTVIEALCGQGPNDHWSMASLDYIPRIDWWDQKFADLAQYYCAGWETSNRSRYKGIGRLLPRDASAAIAVPESGRVFTQRKNASYVEDGFGVGYVNDIAYDLVIDCRGYEGLIPFATGAFFETVEPFTTEGKPGVDSSTERIIATKSLGREVYKIGPVAKIAGRSTEKTATNVASLPENGTALFRYAERTARLAEVLP